VQFLLEDVVGVPGGLSGGSAFSSVAAVGAVLLLVPGCPGGKAGAYDQREKGCNACAP
jgi:hypothetical protein